MEYIKKEKLIKDEIYKHDNGNIVQYQFLDENDRVCGKFIRVPNHFQSDLIDHPGRFTISYLKLATSEEKHWLLECVKLDKFITFEEAMKTFVPEYVECTKDLEDSDYKLGRIYKIRDRYIVGGFGLYDNNKYRFKPSTKEAYDAQFVVKEPEFVLPEKWYISINEDIDNSVKNWFNKQNSSTIYTNCGDIKYLNWSGIADGNHLANYKRQDYIKITFEQFKKYVLKEEIVEEKVIEPLPQFKVIETIETITKVENNEGNQFFIGDIVKSLNSNQRGKITKFKYSNDKSDIIAITTFQQTNGININKIEHYIEPKVVEPEFILPKRWGIKRTSDNDKIITDYINNYSNYNHLYLCNNLNNPYMHNIQGWSSNYKLREGYTEITFDQFKKYVLKEDEPIIIAESTKDMLDLKSKGVDSIVLSQESLLEKAKRLYPIGTRYKVPTNLYPNSPIMTLTSELIKGNGNNIYGKDWNKDCHNKNGAVYFNDIWAEIIEYPHGFKIGDKIRLKYGINNVYHINKIEGNQLIFETDYLPKINSVLAKNAIKVN